MTMKNNGLLMVGLDLDFMINGLKSLKIISDSMLPNVHPDTVIESSVLMNEKGLFRGVPSGQFSVASTQVSFDTYLESKLQSQIHFETTLLSIQWVGKLPLIRDFNVDGSKCGFKMKPRLQFKWNHCSFKLNPRPQLLSTTTEWCSIK